MTQDNLTQEEQINSDNLNSFMNDKIEAHILLKRLNPQGKNIFLNGFIIKKSTERTWIINERVLGEIRVSIAEIKDNGISKYEVEN